MPRKYAKVGNMRINPHKILSDDEKQLINNMWNKCSKDVKSDSIFASICYKLGIDGTEGKKDD